MTAARLAAARILLALDRGHTTLASRLDHERTGLEDPRDRGLLVELAAGTIRWRNELDAFIVAASGRPMGDIDPAARATLRLGVYQWRHLDRVPAHAIVHESVDVVRALGAPRAAGFVNAVLRKTMRLSSAVVLPPRPPENAPLEAACHYLAITLSHPDWLASRWIARVGFDAAEAWCRFNNAPPEITIRALAGGSPEVLLSRLQDAGVDAQPARYVPEAIRLAPGSLGRVPADLREQMAIQDEASQIVAHVVDARAGQRVLDVCAAPGGKTTVIGAAMAMGDQPVPIVAGDHRPKRVALLKDTLARAGVAAHVVALDALRGLPFGPAFDWVLLDVPCSGLGTLRRDPDLKWTRREPDVERLAADALRMLRQAATTVRPGGRLVYATCSGEPEENDAVVQAFLASDQEFTLGRAVPARLPGSAALMDDRGCLATSPAQHGLDAFFAALLVRSRAA